MVFPAFAMATKKKHKKVFLVSSNLWHMKNAEMCLPKQTSQQLKWSFNRNPFNVWRFKFLASLDYLGRGRVSKKSTLVSDQRTVFRVCASSEINILVSMVAYRHKMDSKERLRSMKNLSVWCRRLWQCFMMFDVGSFFLLILMVLLMVDGMGRRGCPWVNASSINPRVGALHQYLHKCILSGMVRSYMCIPSLKSEISQIWKGKITFQLPL